MMTNIIHNSILKAQFSNKGAELISLKYYDKELIWFAQEPWKRHAPILFPIVGKLKDDFYYYQNQKYFLPQHGFARDKEWLCTFQNETFIEFELTDDADTFKYYPFHFSIIAQYSLNNNSLNIHFQILNPYHYPMPFSLGYHPAFYLPHQLNNYYLKFLPHQQEIISSSLNNGLLTHLNNTINLDNSTLKLNTSLFDNDAIVLEKQNIEEIQIHNDKDDYYISIISKGLKNWGIWTKPKCNDFICIEPWMGIADVENHNHIIEQKKDIILLQPYQIWEWDILISINENK